MEESYDYLRIDWKDSYDVGSPEMNRQHKRIVNLSNQLLDATLNNQDLDESIHNALKELVDYTRTHFKEEEDLMGKINFPGTERHIKIHEKLRNQVDDLAVRFDQGDLTVPLELLDLIRSWLIDHIMQEDKKYSSLLP